MKQDTSTWLGKGLVMAQKGGPDLSRAQYQFQNVTGTQPDNIAALIGAGNIAYVNKHYNDALAMYKKVL